MIALMKGTRLAILLCAAGCGGSDNAMAPSEFPVQFVVSNNLLAPVAIAIDGVAYASLIGGSSTGLTVSSKAQWLTWISAKPMDSEGQPIQDDISEIRVGVSGINHELSISNVINDQTYITARIHNLIAEPVSIGVYDGSTVACAAQLPAASSTKSGYTQIGYYKLLPATEVRAYRHPSACSGPHIAWSSSQIRDFAAKSGLLTLFLESAP